MYYYKLNTMTIYFRIEYVAQKCNKILEDNANSKIGGYLRQAIEELVMKRKQKKKAVKGVFQCLSVNHYSNQLKKKLTVESNEAN